MADARQRKTIRLKDYDYSQDGAYYITMCVKGRHELLGKINVGDGVLDVPHVELSEYGLILHNQIDEINEQYSGANIDKYIIMPNHVHMIIVVLNSETNKTDRDFQGTSRTPSPTNAVIPHMISTLKRFVNKKCGFSLWQRFYHDHIIRDEKEYFKIWEYIDTNPWKWIDDEYYMKN